MQTGPREGEVRAANEIFTLLPERHDLTVIIDALASRNGVIDETRSELSTRIRKLRIKGFRDANRAPHDQLVETILAAIAEGDHRLAAAILATWMQTHSALRERARSRTCGNEASTSSTRRRCGSTAAGTPTSGCSSATGCCRTLTAPLRTATMPR